MRPRDLVLRGLAYYWRTHVAVVLGVSTAVAVLAGALLVGDSVRGSLRDLALQRLGRVDLAIASSGFFREALASDLERDAGFASSFEALCPVIVLPARVSDQASGRRASQVQVYGVDDRFWRFHGLSGSRGPDGRDALISRGLAADIGAAPGRTVLVRVERPSAVPIESLHGRKDNLGRTLRLTVRAIVAPADLGDFSLRPQQGDVRAMFVPLARLQQDLDINGRANALLVSSKPAAGAAPDALHALIRRRFALEDVGLAVRIVASSAIAVESTAGLIDPVRANAADDAAAAVTMKAQPVLTYLANSMRIGAREVPYSLVTAMDLHALAPNAAIAGGATAPPLVLNDWAAHDLGARVGDSLTLEYYVWEEPGRLLTRTADFQVAAVVPIAGVAADRDLAPVYPGITEASSLGNWDPPFPIDLRRVRKIDEDYWNTYRTTPKAFVPLEIGQRLWRSRFGDRTSIRLAPGQGESLTDARDRYAARLREDVDPFAAGLAVREVRTDALAAARGATDFGEYFTYFSFFLVVSALMLVGLFFRLGVEQRAREVGLLRAVGFTTARVRRLFTGEGMVLAATGGLLGVAGAVAYGSMMMAGLRTWWFGAVGTTALRLHVSPASLAAGVTAALMAAMACIWWTLRGLARLSERSLLAGHVVPPDASAAWGLQPGRVVDLKGGRQAVGPSRLGLCASVAFAVLGATLLAAALLRTIDRTAAFFGSGTSLLIACLCAVAVRLRRPPRSSLGGHGWRPMWHIGFRNAADRPGRSVLAIGVIAAATFILIAVDAFRREGPAPTDRRSGVGGYPLLVDLMLPLVNDPNSRDGRDLLGLSGQDRVAIDPFRLLPGDDASCLNLYEPRNPRVVGASAAFIDSGRFAFQSSLASSAAERANPWLLLNRDLGPDAAPVIADANSITYVLHRQLGDDIVMARGGRPVRLRLVAALSDSVFQGELLMSDASFSRLFPEQEGYRLLLVDAPVDRVARIASAIEGGASDLGADAVETTARLAEFHRVENTYLSTFQTLGGLGLLLGTIGLAAVLLRNVLERRRELALLGAVGYSQPRILSIVVAENVLLLGWGLFIGTGCALVAIAPAVAERGGRVPTTTTGLLLLLAVFGAGLISSLVATRAALRTPLLSALRSE
jgi:putative ABC transport system permease protein